jgi:hypothetical protein
MPDNRLDRQTAGNYQENKMTKDENGTNNGSWFIFDLYTPHGGKITVKESEPDKVGEHLTALIAQVGETLKNNKGWTLIPPPLTQAPATPNNTIQMRDDSGLPVVDENQQPVKVSLPSGTRVYQIQSVYHDQTKPKDGKPGKDVLKIVTIEDPYNTKYGVSCFHPNGIDGWKTWPVGVENKYAPPAGLNHVVIRDPQGDSKYPEVVEFRE